MPPMTLDDLALSAGQSEIDSRGAVVNRIGEVIPNLRSNALDLKGLIELAPTLYSRRTRWFSASPDAG